MLLTKSQGGMAGRLRFKGLEAQTVFCILTLEDEAEMVYTGITRAQRNLVVFDSSESRFRSFFQTHMTAPTREDVLATQASTEKSVKTERAKKRADDELARKAQERKDIAARSESAADRFVLGGDAMQNLSGQGSMFDEPPKPVSKTASVEI